MKEKPDVLDTVSLAYTLLDGAGTTVTLAAAGATWRIMRHYQDGKRTRHRTESDEVRALRRVVDGVMLFLVGRKGENGLPDTEGFVERFDRFEDDVSASLTDIRDELASLAAEWRPNGGHSSYDRLRRLDERRDP